MLWFSAKGRQFGPAPALSLLRKETSLGCVARLRLSMVARLLVAVGLLAFATLTFGQSVSLTFGQFVTLPSPTPIGTSSAVVSVPVALPLGGALASVRVRTGGVDTLDFSISGSADCAPGGVYLPSKVCHFPIVFHPKYPGERVGAVILLDTHNIVLGSTNVIGTGQGPLSLFVPGTIQTVAGDASWIYRPGDDGIPATTSPIYLPYGVTVDGAGNLYIADGNNNRIRRVDVSTGLISTIAGNGNSGFSGDGGLATAASLSLPSAVAIDATGNLFFADSGNHVIRRVNAFTGIITTIAGQIGIPGYSGDGQLGTLALLNSPSGVALDAKGHLYIADTLNNVVRQLDLGTGLLTAFAGNHHPLFTGDGGAATSASLNGPFSVTVAASGEVYIADQGNHCVRKVATNGNISTIAGQGIAGFSGDGSAAVGSLLNSPSGVAVDVAGNIYISDSGNNRVRKINAVSGVIQTVIGSGDETFQGDGQAADTAGLYGPYGLALDGAGDLFIADVFHNRVRMVSSNSTTLFYKSIRANKVSLPQSTTLENDGNAPLHFSSVSAVTNAQVDTPTTTCTSSAAVNQSLTCVIGADFAPTSVGDPIVGSIAIASDSPNSAQTITLEGPATRLDTAIVGLTSSGSPSAFGSPVLLTATLATSGTSTPTGTVTFLDGSTVIGTGVLDSFGIARLTISTLALGPHTLSVTYPGDSNNEPAVSPTVTQVVKNGTTVRLTATPPTSTYHQSVTFVAVATGVSAVPTGTMTFFDGSTSLGTVSLDNTGSASFTTSTLSVGTHPVTATYSGDAVAIGNTSSPFAEIVTKSSSSVLLTGSPATSSFSGTVNFKAVVSSLTGGTPSGSVTFSDGTSVLQSVPLDAAGTAALPVSTLSVGAHILTASYSGDGNNDASVSLPLSQSITTISTTTLLSSNLSPVPAGGTVRLTATVTGTLNPAGFPLTGSVLFMDGSATLGTATLASGIAFVDVTSPSIGQHSIIATYNGAPDYATSASVALSLTVQQATTTSTLIAAPLPGIAGKAVLLTSTVTGNGGTPTGIVIFKDGQISLGQGTLNSAGTAIFSTSTLSPGAHLLTASYGGDANDQTSGASLNFNIQQATTGTVLTSSGSPSVFGLAVTLSAVVSGTGGTPSGTVTFFEGTTALGATQLDNTGKATLALTSFGVGTHTLSAVYAGDTNDATSTSAAWSQIIQKTTTNTTLITSASAISQGSPVLFTAQVSSNAGLPGGVVQFFDGSTLLGTATLSQAGIATFSTSALVAGQHNITAVFPGDSSNGASTSTNLAQLVNPVTLVGVTVTPNPASTGATVTLTAGVSGAHTLPTGTVTFFDGNAILGTAPLNVAGVASLSTSTLPAGAHAIKASYGGDANNAGGVSGVTTLQINQATTQTVLTLGSTTAGLGAPVTVTAAVTGTGGVPTGTITFLDGGVSLGTATLNAAGVASYTTTSLGIGAHSLTASYAGDSNDGASTSAASVLTVAKQTAQLAIDTGSNPALAGTAVSFTASLRVTSGAPTGTIVWSDGSTVLATTPVSGSGTSSFTTQQLAPGQPHTITAAYSGDGIFQGTTSNTIAESVNQGTSAVTLITANASAPAGTAVSLSISVTGTGTQPGGSIVINDNGVKIGTATLDGSGNASFITAALGVGDHALTAAYAGDVNHTASQSGTVAEHVSANSSSTVLLSSKNPATAGDVIAFNVAVAGSGPQPGGTVQLTDSGVPFGPKLTLDSNGAASYTPSTPLNAGTHSIVATYTPDAAHTGSASTVLSEVIAQATSNITLASSKNPASAGDLITLSVAVTGTGPQVTGTVQITDNGNPLGSKLAIDNNGIASFLLLTPLSPGTHSLLATYGGDANHTGSTSSVLTQSVAQTGTATTLSANNNPAPTGSQIVFTIAVSNTSSNASGVPTGTVTVTDGPTTLATGLVLDAKGSTTFTSNHLAVGQHAVVATYLGDANHTGSQSSALVETLQQATTLTLSSNANPAAAGSAIVLTVTTTGFGGSVPIVVTIEDGNTVLTTVGLDASGTATVTTSTLAVGPHSLSAHFAGDATHLKSDSAVYLQNVGQLSSSTNLASSKNPALAGDLIALTVSVTGSGAQVTGSVQITDNGVALGPKLNLDANGLATLALSAPLSPGAHSLVAVYSGDTNHNGSASTPLAQSIAQTTTTTTLASDVNPSNAGKQVSFTIVVANASANSAGAPGGTVTISDAGTVIASALPLNGNGQGVFSTSNLAVGQHTLTAVYSGDSNHLTSQSAAMVQTVQASTSLALSSSQSPADFGSSVVLTVTTTGFASSIPTVVTLHDGAATLATIGLDASGTASFSTTTLAVGTHVLTAQFAGDATHLASQSAAFTQVVGQLSTRISLVSSKSPALAGDALTWSAVVSSNGAVPTGTLLLNDGTTTIGTAVLDGTGTAQFHSSTLLAGLHTLVAVYAGDTDHAGSNSTPLNQVVQQSTQTALTSGKNPSTGGSAVTFTATVTPSGTLSVTGKVTFLDGATVLGTVPVNAAGLATYLSLPLSPGQHSISASYSGDAVNQASASSAILQQVDNELTTTTLSSSGSPAFVTAAVTLNAQVAGGSNAPTGTVNFLDGSTLLGTGTVNAGGLATLTTTALHAGPHVLLAIYQGDGNHANSTSNPLQELIQQQTTTLLTSGLNPAPVTANIPFVVTVSAGAGNSVPTGQVTLMDGAATLGISILDGKGNATFALATLPVGPHSLTAMYGGDAQNTPSTSGTLAESVQLHVSTTVLGLSATSTLVGQPIVLTATLSGDGPVPPSGTVVFTSGSTVLGTAVVNASGVNSQSSNPAGNTSTATLSITGVKGSYGVVATYAGDSLYSGSASASGAVTVDDPPNFTIVLSPNTMALSSKQHSTLQITLTSLQGFSDTLALGCVGLPASATCTFSTDHSKLDPNGNQVIQLTVDTGSPLVAGGAATARNDLPVQSLFASSRTNMCLLPGSLALILLLVRSRRSRRMLPTLLALLITAVSFAVSGCGSLDVNGTPAGQYTFNITAIGAKTAVTQSAPLQLKVTQ